MTPSGPNPYHGIYTATICPMALDGSVDESTLARHLADAVATEGVVGVLINGHAGENFMLSRAEKKRVVEIAQATNGDRARLVRRVQTRVAVMAAGDEHLLPCMTIGSEGSMVSLAVLVPDLIVALDRAIAASDLATARSLNDRIYPLATAIYGTPPSAHATARLKACLKLMGKLSNAAMRPPMGPLPP